MGTRSSKKSGKEERISKKRRCITLHRDSNSTLLPTLIQTGHAGGGGVYYQCSFHTLYYFSSQVDCNGEFHLLGSHIVSLEKLYVHPVQETSGKPIPAGARAADDGSLRMSKLQGRWRWCGGGECMGCPSAVVV